jgi:AraC-like DNA-binding protein
VRRGAEVWFSRSFAPALRRGRRQVNDFALMLVLGTIRLGAGADWRPSEIRFDGPPPSHAAELAALAERGVHFGDSSTTLVFPRQVLELPIPPAVPVVAGRPLPRSALPASEFRGSVRQTVASLLRLGSANLTVAAEMSGMSARSLQRRLHEVQLDFGRLVEEARLDSARRMLGDPGLKIVQVAAELGYTDSANFTRAFRRWTGVPPREFRRSHASL